MTPTDQACLIALARRGNLRAFNQLVLAHQSSVYNLVWWILVEPNAAARVTDRVFVAAFRTLAGCREDGLRAWLARIAFAECQRVPAEWGVKQEGPGALPAQLPAGLEVEPLVVRALGSLPRRERSLLVLADVMGFSDPEISAITGLGASQIRARLASARLRITRFLATEKCSPRQV